MCAAKRRNPPDAGGSRRPGRPARLSTETVTKAALAYVREHHLNDLTMRELGRLVDATPMALYRHIGSKQDLARELTDIVLGSITIPEDDVEAVAWLRELAVETRQALLQYPGTADLLLDEGPSVLSALRLLDRVIRRFQAEGMSVQQATELHNTFFSWLAGFVRREVVWQRSSDGARGAMKLFRARASALPAEEFPGLAAAMPFLRARDQETEFQASLTFMLEAVAARLSAVRSARPSKRARKRTKSSGN